MGIRAATLFVVLVTATLTACQTEPRWGEPARLRVFIDREEVFPASLELLGSARSEILVGMYFLGGFEDPHGGVGIGKAVVDLLAEKRAEGVRVRVITQFKRALSDRRTAPPAGDPWFAPVFEYARAKGLAVLNPGMDPDTKAIDHRKFFVVDGARAILGGMNFAEAVGSNHDAMLFVEGPIVERLRSEFWDSWRLAESTVGDSASPIPALRAPGAPSPSSGESEWDDAQARLTRTTPTSKATLEEMKNLLRKLKRGSRLDVASLLFSDREMLAEVIDAHERGARVRVLLDANRAYYGVDCNYAYNARVARALHDAGVEVRFFDNVPGQEMHLKLLLARTSEREIFSLGSTNLTRMGMRENFELQLFGTDAPNVFSRLLRNFERKWSDQSTPVPAFVLEATPDQLRVARNEARRRVKTESWAAMVR